MTECLHNGTGRHRCRTHDYIARHNLEAQGHHTTNCVWFWLCGECGEEIAN